ncbi:MAG: hypothetical protein IKR57_04595 [Bacilli bacterium]|nr:hypothetical protein [Bacilli bacterium]
MGLFKKLKSRQITKKARSFIKTLKNKSDKEIELAYLRSEGLEDNEIVLSYIFFNHHDLIKILPIDFQVSRINSNLTMFEYGSDEAKKKLIKEWLDENKLFTNALVINFSEEELNEYLKLYFKEPDGIALLHMEDLRKTISALSKHDLKQTEEIIKKIKDKFTDRQWEFIVEVNPRFIKYASQSVQDKYSDNEEYSMYLNGEAKDKYIEKQVEKIKEDVSLLDTMSVEVQKEYVSASPYMINYLKIETLIELLKFDIDLIKYVDLTSDGDDDSRVSDIICGILDSISTKSNKEIVNILVNKCLLNAKGKLYRFDFNSSDISFQYTKRIIHKLQGLSIEQVLFLVNVDVNYILPYVVPLYKDVTEKEEKLSRTEHAKKRCLEAFKKYYNDEIYNSYNQTICKIYDEYANNIERYDFTKDYRCIFDFLKILFNKKIIENNTSERVNTFILRSIESKNVEDTNIRVGLVSLLNELLNNAYNINTDNNREIYNINSLELFDSKLSFISKDLIIDYSKFNFVNVSNLLLIIKSNIGYELFKTYYELLSYIYGENKETLYRAIENFNYYKDIISDIKDKSLNEKELNNLTLLLATFGNRSNIKSTNELSNYDLTMFKQLVNEVASVKDEKIYKNLLCNYLFNKGYDEKGNSGWLEVITIKSICDLFEVDSLNNLIIDDKKVFDDDEVNLFSMTKLLFSSDDFDLVLSFIENIISNKVERNILSVSELFNKIKKYRVELINLQIVSLDEIKELYEDRPDVVTRNFRDGIEIFTIVGQDFRVLYSTNDDGIHYYCDNVSALEKNSYGYDRLERSSNIRFSIDNDKTVIKAYQNSDDESSMRANYIIVVGKVSDDLINIAKENNLTIVEIQS